jgi:hypothetical protein
MKSRKFVRTLQYKFSKDEMDDLANKLTDAVEQLAERENRKSAITKQAAAEVAAAKATQDVILGKRRAGYEFRDIECEETFDIETRMATVIRLDTGEQVENRPMTAKELQVELPLPSDRPTSGSREIDAGIARPSKGGVLCPNTCEEGDTSDTGTDADADKWLIRDDSSDDEIEITE